MGTHPPDFGEGEKGPTSIKSHPSIVEAIAAGAVVHQSGKLARRRGDQARLLFCQGTHQPAQQSPLADPRGEAKGP